jgi:subtilisin family serine protease
MRLKRSSAALAIASAALVGTAGSAAATSAATSTAAPPRVPASTTAAIKPAKATTGPAVTLLTGDKVRLDTGPGGKPHLTVVHDASPGGITVEQINGDVYALPGEALSLIARGRLDQQLFDVTRLVHDGYDDAHTSQLPVIATYAQPAVRSKAAAALSAGVTRGASLASIDGQAMRLDKARAGKTWTTLTGSSATAPKKLWLDDKVHASDDVSGPAIGAPDAWAAGYDGTGVKVAVLDTGIDASHPDFAGHIAATQSFIPGETAADGYGHGTHVASIVAGSGAASGGQYKGIAPGAQLLIGKVLDNTGTGTDSEIIAGMQWAAAQGAKVANLSLGGAPTNGTDPLSQALNQISQSSGTLFVVAAGNNGAPESVDAPGSADQALTVGAVDKTAPYNLASYSSQGPRLGDHAVKPDITAPGSNIIAAAAKGSYLANALDPNGTGYMPLSGTSMATPHVTGAAAILAEEHPDWTAQQLKDDLVSTADPNPATPVTGQGGGMVDLRRAIATPLVDTGTLSLDSIEPPYAPATGTVTLHNTSSQPVHADLTLNLFKGEGSTQAYTPPAGAVTVSPSSVDIPAGGSTTVTVTVNAAGLDIGYYFGWLQATSGGTVVARTTVGWAKDPTLYRLRVRGTDRAGNPANTTCCDRGSGATAASWVTLINLDTQTVYFGTWDLGAGYFETVGTDPLLPAGRYAVLSDISDWTAGQPYTELSETYGGDPEFVLNSDRTITIDARQGKQVQIRTPLPSELTQQNVTGRPGYLSATLVRTVTGANHQTLNWSTSIAGRSVYVIPTHQVTTGQFQLQLGARLAAPALTMISAGPGAPPILDARYPAGGYDAVFDRYDSNSAMADVASVFASPGRYQLVDAGAGTPAELAAAGVRGKLALIHEDPGSSAYYNSFQVPVDAVIANAAAAGAAGVVYAVADNGPPVRSLARHAAIPVAIIPHQQGQALAAAAQAGPVGVRTGGTPVSPYLYDLQFTAANGALPADPVFHVGTDQLATIHARYHADSPGQVDEEHSGGWDSVFTAPFTRTEYVSPVVGQYGQQVYAYRPDGRANLVEFGPVRTYQAGASYTVDHLTAPTYPQPAPGWPGAAVATSQEFGIDPQANGVGISEYVNAGEYTVGYAYNSDNPGSAPQSHWVFRSGGTVLCDYHFEPGYCDTYPNPIPPGPLSITVDTDNGGMQQTSTTTHTEWDLANPSLGANEVPAALILVNYHVPLDLTNTVHRSDYQITVGAQYQNGYTSSGPAGFTLTAWASYDGGQTWTPLGSHPASQDGNTQFNLHTPPGATDVTLRVKATDTQGNSIDQTITKAWHV